jgi:N-acetylglucosamine kinase-like BadF-type ATPase
MARFFLGIDGGQSSTTCLVGDESGRVIGVGRAGPCNHVGAALGRARFLSAMRQSSREAIQRAGLASDTRFAAAACGLSGGPADKAHLIRDLIPAEEYFITHDAMTALAGATGGAPGVVTIAGTGSIAFGCNADGEAARAGGWGYVFGDEGGAFDIVRRALRAMLQHEEGWGAPTTLREALLSASGAKSADDLLHRFYTDEYPRERIAGLAPVVDQAAESGDPVAIEILNAAAQELAAITAVVATQLFPAPPVDVRHAGGVFRSRRLLARFTMLAEMREGWRVSPPLHGPAAGALIEAYRLVQTVPELTHVPEET